MHQESAEHGVIQLEPASVDEGFTAQATKEDEKQIDTAELLDSEEEQGTILQQKLGRLAVCYVSHRISCPRIRTAVSVHKFFGFSA